ncbi:MAG TPA: Gfo/Idh/MocA family oxidoreductase [Bryobacteraceae bacterium]|nr:Gfo/Idh/MocA family oxidoreductase [Bryobacteraceae bacterium]
MTNIGICGVGNIGRVHLDNLRSLRGCRIAGVADSSATTAAKAAAYAGVRCYASAAELMCDRAVEAVVIATPTDSHLELCRQALSAGKHVFVEKPLAGTLEDARAIVELARSSDRVVQAGFCERFNVNYLEARRAVTTGALGKLRAIHSSRVAPYSMSNPAWDLGVFDTAVHNIDLTLWLMGRLPVSVLARGSQVYSDSSIPHTATTLMTFADGAMAVDQITWLKDDGHPLSQCARSRMFLQGDLGSFHIDLNERPSALLDKTGLRQIDTVILGAPEYSGCLKLQFEYFLRSIEEGAPVLAPVEDALQAERVVVAAVESLKSGREVRLDDLD